MVEINTNYYYNNSNPYQNYGAYYNENTTNTNNQHGYYYQQKDPRLKDLGVFLALGANALIYKALPSFSNPFLKQIQKEHSQNYIYKDFFEKAVNESGLDVKIINNENPATDVGKGLNAYFTPSQKTITLNKNKASIAGFHELGHAMNAMNKGFGRVMSKLRRPGEIFASLIAILALTSKNKAKDDKRNLIDVIQDNCGKLAFLGMMPVVIEEGMASYKGIKAAEEAGLKEPHVKNLRKFYGKALLSYFGYALLAGFAAFTVSKIMDIFTRPKKIEY